MNWQLELLWTCILLIIALVEFQNFLQPEVKKLKSYVKDTLDFIKKIEFVDHLSDDSYLVSLDVRSLYINIPHKEGIEAVKQKLKKSKRSISIKVILTLLKLILTLILYSMAWIISRKKIALWELSMRLTTQIFLRVGLRKSLYFYLWQILSDFYLRFIADIFLIWNGTKTQFDNFFKKN